MTYIVMETHLSYSVVLDEAGCFLKVANMNHEVGQTVERVVPIDLPEKKVIPFRLISAVGAVAACFVLLFSVYWSNYMSPFASIYLTINPEVKMEISRRDTVVGLEGMNADGASLIAGYGFRGRSITQVADDLVDRAIGMGFLSNGGMVTVNIDAPDEAWFESTGITLRQNLNDHLSERMAVTIEVKQYEQPAGPAFHPGETPDSTAGTQPATQPPSAPPPTEGDSGYGDSAYGGDSGYSQGTGDSGYGGGDSGYTQPSTSPDDSDTGYTEPDPPPDDGDSGYTEPDPPPDDGDSGYEDQPPDQPDGGDSSYDDEADDD